jgi:hypothetical protein
MGDISKFALFQDSCLLWPHIFQLPVKNTVNMLDKNGSSAGTLVK